QHFQAVPRMHPVQEIAPPAFGRRGLLILFVVIDEFLLLIGIGLEEEAADLMKGAAQAPPQLAHATWGEPSTEGLLDPIARLGGRREASAGDRAFAVVEWRRFPSARVALVLEGQPRLQPTALVELQPVADGAGTDSEELGDLVR